MPFGLTNAPAKFQRTMDEIFHDGLYERCIIYIDDILVYGQTEKELLNNLEWIFELCRKHNVKLKKSKCKFMAREVDFLGFKVTENEIYPVPDKLDCLSIKTPANKTDVRAILGSFNFYARFIENYSDKTSILRYLTAKNSTFEWNEEHSQAVDNLRKDLKHAMPHAIPNSYSQKKIHIHVSLLALEISCFELDDKLIARTGCVLTDSQITRTSVELQLTGIVMAYSKFGPFLRGPVTFIVTGRGLKEALTKSQRTDRITRLVLELPPECEFEIEVIPAEYEISEELSEKQPREEIFYTDGACKDNGKPNCRASWAVLATLNNKLSKSGIVDCMKPTNQVAEIFAINKACEIALDNDLKHISIITDSKYAAGAISKWIKLWQNNNWRDHKGKEVINREHLELLADYLDKLDIICKHVKGHSTDLNNLKVDRMAREQLESMLSEKLNLITSYQQISNRGDSEAEFIKLNMNIDPCLQDMYEIKDDELYYIDHNLPKGVQYRLFVPKNRRVYLLEIAHNDIIYGGHQGIRKTKYKLLGYYWPKMNNDIEKFVRSCITCQQNKNPRKTKFGLLQPIPISELFERIHIDIVGPIKGPDPNLYIITAIDSFSRYGFAKACEQVKSTDITKFILDEIVTKHGLPSKIVSDNGPQFISKTFSDFTNKLGIKHSRTVDYHPQANGIDERFNGTLGKLLRNYVKPEQDNWSEQLQWTVLLYNTTYHESLGTSPYVAVYGVSPRSVLRNIISNELNAPTERDHNERCEDIRSQIRINMIQAQNKQKSYYDLKRRPQNFKLLDPVLAINHRVPEGLSKKLHRRWDGPYIITRFITSDEKEVAVELCDLATRKLRRTAFQDIKHLEEDIMRRAEQRQTLPGDLLRSLNDEKDDKEISIAEMTQTETSWCDESVPSLNNLQLIEYERENDRSIDELDEILQVQSADLSKTQQARQLESTAKNQISQSDHADDQPRTSNLNCHPSNVSLTQVSRNTIRTSDRELSPSGLLDEVSDSVNNFDDTERERPCLATQGVQMGSGDAGNPGPSSSPNNSPSESRNVSSEKNVHVMSSNVTFDENPYVASQPMDKHTDTVDLFNANLAASEGPSRIVMSNVSSGEASVADKTTSLHDLAGEQPRRFRRPRLTYEEGEIDAGDAVNSGPIGNVKSSTSNPAHVSSRTIQNITDTLSTHETRSSQTPTDQFTETDTNSCTPTIDLSGYDGIDIRPSSEMDEILNVNPNTRDNIIASNSTENADGTNEASRPTRPKRRRKQTVRFRSS